MALEAEKFPRLAERAKILVVFNDVDGTLTDGA